jgi:predicted RNA-binding Zn ribbon-like protein
MSSQAAPGRLEHLRQFVNTLDLETGEDELADPDALAAWLEGRGLRSARRRVGKRDLERAIELRETLRELLLANNGVSPQPRSIEALNRVASEAALSVRFDADGSPALLPRGSGPGGVVAPLIAIAYEAMVAGTWPRLKACLADDCRWVFYDRSKNRSGTWCAMQVCGNRAKVRAYRERRVKPSPRASA